MTTGSDYFTGGCFSSTDGREYAVERTVRWAASLTSPTAVNVRRLIPGLLDGSTQSDEELGSPAYEERASRADLRYPLLVVRSETGLWVADGNHRLWKAYRGGRRRVRAYVVNLADIPEHCLARDQQHGASQFMQIPQTRQNPQNQHSAIDGN